jgi:hypothetical protein
MTAKLVPSVERHDERAGHPRSYALIDLGFGCGDQTLYLFKGPHENDHGGTIRPFLDPDIDTYMGITHDQAQFHFARHRVQDSFRGSEIAPHNAVRVYCADGARPTSWAPDLLVDVHTAAEKASEVWILGLDSLYHFSPSRWPIIEYASKTLKASYMAFDLCIADHVSYSNLVILRAVTKMMGAPWANFVTEEVYYRKLSEAGYRDITIRDVSEHVFDPLADFLAMQHQDLRRIGLGLGEFQAALWMFRWWAKSGAVRGIIVVAK